MICWTLLRIAYALNRVECNRDTSVRTVALMRTYSPSSSRYAALSDPKTQRFDIEFVLQAMKQFVTDRSVVAQTDQRQALRR